MPTLGTLRRRRHTLAARIAGQRTQLEHEFGGLRDPLQVFEAARGCGDALRRHAGLAAVLAAGAAFVLIRGGLLSRVLLTLQLAGRAARWWLRARPDAPRLRPPA